MAWIGAVVGAVTGIAQMVGAANTEIEEDKEFKPTPQMRGAERMAERRAKEGLSPTERALYENRQAGRSASAERNLRNLGMGQFAPSVKAMYDVEGSAQIAALSEQEKRRGEQQYTAIAGQMQGIQDRQTSSFNQMLQQQRQAVGSAFASGAQNLTSAIGTAASAANTNKLAAAYENSGDTVNINMGGDGNSGFGRQGVDGGIDAAPGATAPGVAQPMTLEGSGIPFSPAADQNSSIFSPEASFSPMQQTPNTIGSQVSPVQGQLQMPGQVDMNMGYNDPNNPNNPNFIEGGEVLPNSMFGF